MKKVASIAVVRKDHILCLRRTDTGKWTLPGGHFEPGETPVQAAIRELWEETGIEVEAKDLKPLGVGHVGNRYEIHSFEYRPDKIPQAHSRNDPDEEGSEFLWLEDGPLNRETAHVPPSSNITLILMKLVTPSDNVKILTEDELSKNEALVGPLVDSLTDDLRKPKYRGHQNPLTGHCYVASEALYHLMGGRKSDWVPHNIKHEGDQHWYLKNRATGEIIDPTAGQFQTPVPYHLGRGEGFLTAEPSKRAAELISRIQSRMAAKRGGSAPVDIKTVGPTHADSGFTDPDPWTESKYRKGGEQEFSDWVAPTPGPDEHPDLHKNESATDEQRKLWKTLGGKTSVLVGFRAHKNSPHNPMAVFLKYGIHRIENPELYEGKTPEQIEAVDAEWLKHHQQGKAAEKNGHITVRDLHDTLAKNPNYLTALRKEQAKLHKALLYHARANIVNINGEPHLPLARGYSVDKGKLDIDHSLASYADAEERCLGFGGNLFRWYVPLKNIWYSYDLGPKEATSSSYGNEDEYLVSPHPRREAPEDSIRQHVPRRKHTYAFVTPRKAFANIVEAHKQLEARRDSEEALPKPDSKIEEDFKTALSAAASPEERAAITKAIFTKAPNALYHLGQYSEVFNQLEPTKEVLDIAAEYRHANAFNLIMGAQAYKHLLSRADPEIVELKHLGKTPSAINNQLETMHRSNKLALNISRAEFDAQPDETKEFLWQHKNADPEFAWKEMLSHVWNVMSRPGIPKSLSHISPEDLKTKLTEAARNRPEKSTRTIHDVVGNLMQEEGGSPEHRDAVMDWYTENGADANEAMGYFGSWMGPKYINLAAKKHLETLNKPVTEVDWREDSDARAHLSELAISPRLSDELAEKVAQKVSISNNEYRMQNLPVSRLNMFHKHGQVSLASVLNHTDLTPEILHDAVDTSVRRGDLSPALYELAHRYSKENNPALKEALYGLHSKTLGQLQQHNPDSYARTIATSLSANNLDGTGRILERDIDKHLSNLGLKAHREILSGMYGKGKASDERIAAFADRVAKHPLKFNSGEPYGDLAADVLGQAYYATDSIQTHPAMLPAYKRVIEHMQEVGQKIPVKQMYLYMHPNLPESHLHKVLDNLDVHNANHTQRYYSKLDQSFQNVHEAALHQLWNHPNATPELKTKINASAASSPAKLKPVGDPGAVPDVPKASAGGESIRDFIANKQGLKRPGRLAKGIGTALAVGGMMALGQMSPKLKEGFDKVNPPAQQQVEKVTAQSPKWTPDGLHSYLVPIAHLESSWGKNMNHAPNSKGEYHTAYGPVGFKPSTAHEEWSKSKKLKETFPGLEDPATFMDKFKNDWKFHNLLASAHFLRLFHRHGSVEKAAYAWRWGSTAASGATDEQINKEPYVMRYRDLSASTGIKKSEDLTKMAVGTIRAGAEVQDPNVLANFDSRGARTFDVHDYSHVLPKEARRNYKLFVGSHRGGWKAMARVFHKQDLERGTGRHVGEVKALVRGTTADIDLSSVHEAHQQKGLGRAAYEALYAHLHNVHKVNTVFGEDHSTLAARVHQKLAEVHGFDYPHKNVDTSDGRAFDRAVPGYKYTIR